MTAIDAAELTTQPATYNFRRLPSVPRVNVIPPRHTNSLVASNASGVLASFIGLNDASLCHSEQELAKTTSRSVLFVQLLLPTTP